MPRTGAKFPTSGNPTFRLTKVYLRNFAISKSLCLEIGIQNGGSLEIYSEYFTNPEIIVGCDIDPRCRLLQYAPGIKVVIGDCAADETRSKITAISSSFDLIIDDGSHISDDVIVAFLKYFPFVKPGGVYVIEDLHTSYWQRWQGGLFTANRRSHSSNCLWTHFMPSTGACAKPSVT